MLNMPLRSKIFFAPPCFVFMLTKIKCPMPNKKCCFKMMTVNVNDKYCIRTIGPIDSDFEMYTCLCVNHCVFCELCLLFHVFFLSTVVRRL